MTLHRRTLLAATAGLASLPHLARAADPVRGGTLRVSVDQAAAVLNPLLGPGHSGISGNRDAV